MLGEKSELKSFEGCENHSGLRGNLGMKMRRSRLELEKERPTRIQGIGSCQIVKRKRKHAGGAWRRLDMDP